MSLKAYTVPLTLLDEGTSVSGTAYVTGYLKGLSVTAGNMDASSTYTIALTDAYGMTIFSRASLSESATTTIWADKYNELSTTKVEGELLNTPMVGPVTVTITATAPQYAGAVAYTVYIYYDN